MSTKKLFFALLAGLCLAGCGSASTGTQTVQAQPAPKGSETDQIKNNPKIPDVAKHGILGR